MSKTKLIRITTVPISLEKLLEDQLHFMNEYFEVTAISSDKERLTKFGDSEEVKTFYLPLTRKITPWADLKSVLLLHQFLKREKPLIVHSHTPKAGIVGMTAAFLAKVPLRLHTVAGLPLMEASGFRRKLLNSTEKWTYRFATRVYPNSNGLYNIILEKKFCKSTKMEVLGEGSSNGIDIERFNKEHFTEEEMNLKRTELGIAKNDFVFIFVGRLVKDKGINELINAFIKLLIKFSKISLLLVGPFEEDLDPLKPETLNIISSNSNIHYLGYQEDVRPYFAISDILVFPSYREGFPNVVMQAGAMGLPSVVTDINGCNEIISDEINGLIIPVKNSEAIYMAMKKILLNPNLFEKNSDEIRGEIASKYDRKKFHRTLLHEYRRLEAEL